MKKIARLSLRKPHSLLLPLLLALLAACQPATPPQTGSTAAAAAVQPAQAIATSDNDARSYRYLELPNKLRVLLISAPNTDKAAAALDVNVGSWQDPADRQGLAHFLEHMLFLGTDRYPNSGEYQSFIAAHGGNHNAFTSFDNTNYFFDIDSRYLDEALDRFSRFFVAPLFTAEYVDREKHAVDSEYQAGIRDDQRRELDVLREVVAPQHPLAKFAVGSLDTLADRPGAPVRDELLKFYDAHYSANLMTLVVIGREPLDELQSMVAKRFADVPNKNRAAPQIDAPLFAADSLPKRVQIQPVQEEYSVSYLWPLPEQRADYAGKSLEYIGNILGHEGDGSLLSYLKQRGWAQGLSAGQAFDYRGGAAFAVNVSLTEAGSAHVDEITQAIYQTIDRVRDGGVQAWLYDEQKNISMQRFRFRDLPQPIADASHLAGNLQDYPAAEVIRGDYLMNRFEPQRIEALLADLTPQRMLMTVTAPQATADRSSAFYHTPYSVQTPTAAQVQSWTHAPANAAIHLPTPNIFVADTLQVKPLANDAPQKPVALRNGNGLHLWYQQDALFGLPKAAITLDIRSKLANDSPQHVVATELLVRVLRENLNEFSYPAMLAGLSYEVSSSGRGIGVRVQGFDPKADVLLERVLDSLRQAQIAPATLARVADEYRRELQDNSKHKPHERLDDDLGNVLVRNHWQDRDLIRYARSFDAAQLRSFAVQLLAHVDVQALVYGNVVADDAQRVADLVEHKLLAGAQAATVPPLQIMQLPLADYRRTLPSEHADAGLLLYRQAGDNTVATRVALGVSARILAPDFFDKLRTEQQLGYIVGASVKPIRDVPGIVFVVQSPSAGTAKLDGAFREFFRQWAARSPDELRPLFERNRATLVQLLNEKPKNFGEANALLWDDLASGILTFDGRAQRAQAAQALSFEQWLPLFRRDVLAPAGHNLWLSVDGRFARSALQGGRDIGALETFKRKREYYSFD